MVSRWGGREQCMTSWLGGVAVGSKEGILGRVGEEECGDGEGEGDGDGDGDVLRERLDILFLFSWVCLLYEVVVLGCWWMMVRCLGDCDRSGFGLVWMGCSCNEVCRLG